MMLLVGKERRQLNICIDASVNMEIDDRIGIIKEQIKSLKNFYPNVTIKVFSFTEEKVNSYD